MKVKKSLVIRWIITGAALLLTVVGTLCATLSVEFADWYAFNVYPALVNIFARISGIFPFSLAEIAITLAVIAALTAIVYFIVQLVRRKGRRLSFLLVSVSNAVLVLSLIAVDFVYSCGINYHRSPFSAYSGITVEKYTKEQLYETLLYLTEKVNGLAPLVELDESGSCVLPEDLSERTAEAMYSLAKQYPVLISYYPQPKPVLMSPLMCYTQIVGIFTPYTMEANYNTCETTECIGYTICHELSHMTGFMREDEANFISYLACRESRDTYLMYSGCVAALRNLLNAYYGETSPEDNHKEYWDTYYLIDERVRVQFTLNAQFWDKYETPVATVSTAINDTYLKINSQSDGTKSYGRMTDLVIAEYLREKNSAD